MTVTDEDRKAAWADWVCELVDAAFERVSRNPNDHEEHLAYRLAIQAAYAAGQERAAVIAEEWRDENKESAAEAQRQGNNGFAAELRTAAVECNALATAIRAEKDKTNDRG